MKTKLKTTILLLGGVMLGGKLTAQVADTSAISKNYVKPFSGDAAFRSWSIGAHVGLLTPYTIVGSNNKQDFIYPETQIGYGGYIKKQVLPLLGIQGDFMRGIVVGTHSQPGGTGVSPYKKYQTNINWAFSLSGNFTVANINWSYQEPFMQAYLTVGAGTMNYTPKITNALGVKSNYRTKGNGSVNEVYIPLGLGLKFNVTSDLNLDMGYQVNFVFSDNFDGYKYGSTNDKFSYAHIGLEYALGNRKKPQLATHNPVSSMRTEYQTEVQQAKTSLQSQVDTLKARNQALKNSLDDTNANLAKLTTDSDGDGVVDVNDKCPGTLAGIKVDGSGCPLPKPVVKAGITDEDKMVVKEAIKGLEFDLGKATIRERSYPSLDRVANLLINKDFSLKLAGYTDNKGSAILNKRLSTDRAEAIKSYLVSKGVNASHIEATGYGAAHPIASNKTAKGRQANRRVEFTLF